MADLYTPILSPDYNQGYPSPVLTDVSEAKTQVRPFPKILPLIESEYNQGYPSPIQTDVSEAKTQVSPFPKILPSVIPGYNEGYPVIQEIDVSIVKTQVYPFPRIPPAVIPGYNEDYPVVNDIDMATALTQDYPFPRILPDTDHPLKLEGYPSFDYLPPLDGFGAFSNCTDLDEEMVIPSSVKFIDDYAFYNSNLKVVTIATDCRYYSHSFPPGCHIKPNRN